MPAAWCAAPGRRARRAWRAGSARRVPWPARLGRRAPIRAAASSMASGMPSSRRQTWAMAPASASVTVKAGLALLARSTNNCTLSMPLSDSALAGGPAGGTASGGTCQRISPRMASGSRLVARMVSGGCASSSPTRPATASRTCSQLSMTSSVGSLGSAAATWSWIATTGCSDAPSACSTASGTCSGALTGPRSAQNVPPANLSRDADATSRASRVLPTPPGPVSVTSRSAASSWVTASASACRPNSGVIDAGSTARGRTLPPAAGGPALSAGCTTAMPSLAACASSARSAGGKRSASAIIRTVDSRGAFLRPCSIAAIVAGLRRHRSASASWVRLAAIRYRRSNLPKDSLMARIPRSLQASIRQHCATQPGSPDAAYQVRQRPRAGQRRPAETRARQAPAVRMDRPGLAGRSASASVLAHREARGVDEGLGRHRVGGGAFALREVGR